MKKLVGLKEFRNNMGTFVNKVNKGESFIVLSRSKPIFKISPIIEEDWEEIIDFTRIKKGGVNVKDLMKRL